MRTVSKYFFIVTSLKYPPFHRHDAPRHLVRTLSHLIIFLLSISLLLRIYLLLFLILLLLFYRKKMFIIYHWFYCPEQLLAETFLVVLKYCSPLPAGPRDKKKHGSAPHTRERSHSLFPSHSLHHFLENTS